uniref:Uncharacterized protein n=1 Tax=Sphaerodactylus townsendi TaxID=933632 RepID=A0ACB8G4Q7_9SAUR
MVYCMQESYPGLVTATSMGINSRVPGKEPGNRITLAGWDNWQELDIAPNQCNIIRSQSRVAMPLIVTAYYNTFHISHLFPFLLQNVGFSSVLIPELLFFMFCPRSIKAFSSFW